VNGTAFTSDATVAWNGSLLPTKFVSDTRLTAAVPADLIKKPGKVTITITTLGVTKGTATFTVASAPAITSLNPAATTVGGPDSTLAVDGSDFDSSSVVQWNGMPLTTTFISAAQLTATVPADLVATVRIVSITVTTQGATSRAVTFIVTTGPAIASLSPPSAVAGGPTFTLTVTGSGFTTGSIVFWNGTALPATFANPNQLIATVAGALIAAPGAASVTIATGDLESPPASFVISPGPTSAGSLDASAILGAATFAHATVSPGELLTIFGENIGPRLPFDLSLGTNGNVSTTLGGFTIFFDDIAAPLVYASSNQVNVIVPYWVAGNPKTSIHFELNGQRSNYVSVPVTQTSPGLFTIASSGTGPGAILNQDGSVNSAANPAPRGSIVSVYATGYGPTWPATVDGSVNTLPLENSALPIAAYIADESAPVAYAGAAPGLVAGVLQVNVKIPIDAPIGDAVSITLTMDSVISKSGVTISIK
jgi:uncharacterized protein (TIGR03437 family)